MTESTTDVFEPTPAGDTEVREQEGRWVLIMTRELRHAPAKVWRALTDPAELAAWAPFDPSRDLGATGPVTLAMVGGEEPEETPSTVLRAEPPRLLEYTWGEDLLRWELEPTAAGTRLTLRHSMDDRGWLGRVAAGWHLCLDVADLALDGRPVGRIVAGAAKRHGWERLNAEYSGRFGIPEAGWPEGMPEG